MSRRLADNALLMPRSGIRRVFDLVSSMSDVIHLEVGEPNFPTPPHVVEASVEAARNGYTKYTPNAGIPELREAIADKLRRHHGFVADPTDIIVTAGATEGLYSTFLTLLNPGDRVLVPEPGWPNFSMQVHIVGGIPVPYPVSWEEGFVPRTEDLERLISEDTTVLVINSPSNPTGAVIGRDRLREVLDLAAYHDLWVVADDCYSEILFEGDAVRAGSLDRDNRVITVDSFSKSYAMTGWRIGYVVAPPKVADTLSKIQEPVISCVNGPTQWGALAALTGPQDLVEDMRDSYRDRRDRVFELFDDRGVRAFRPRGAFYVWVDVTPSGLTGDEFALRLVEETRVAVVPGTTFGQTGEGWVRISLATSPEELVEGVRRLLKMLDGALSDDSKATYDG